MKYLAPLVALVLFFSAPVHAQGLPNNPATALVVSGLTRFVRPPTPISVTIPAIGANTTTDVTVTVNGVQPGDGAYFALTGSTAVPTGIVAQAPYGSAANQITVRYSNVLGLATTASTTVTYYVTYWGP